MKKLILILFSITIISCSSTKEEKFKEWIKEKYESNEREMSSEDMRFITENFGRVTDTIYTDKKVISGETIGPKIEAYQVLIGENIPFSEIGVNRSSNFFEEWDRDFKVNQNFKIMVSDRNEIQNPNNVSFDNYLWWEITDESKKEFENLVVGDWNKEDGQKIKIMNDGTYELKSKYVGKVSFNGSSWDRAYWSEDKGKWNIHWSGLVIFDKNQNFYVKLTTNDKKENILSTLDGQDFLKSSE
jgi:hypothetical protein|tara:strand:+ start:87 stop:815 length:729 start_codon:yes stop_codon:yes gene_type:complete